MASQKGQKKRMVWNDVPLAFCPNAILHRMALFSSMMVSQTSLTVNTNESWQQIFPRSWLAAQGINPP